MPSGFSQSLPCLLAGCPYWAFLLDFALTHKPHTCTQTRKHTCTTPLCGACRPAEILARCSTALSQLCLAEAQALTAFRASQRPSSSGSLVASLQAGAAELYEKAAKTIRDYIGAW